MAIAAQLFVGGRRYERAAVDLDGTLRDTAWQPIDVEVVDLSVSGFRARLPVPMAIGDQVSIGIAGLGVNKAQVVRAEPGSVACRFARDLPANYLQNLRVPEPEQIVPAANLIAANERALSAIASPAHFAPRTRLLILIALATAGWAAVGTTVAILV